MTGMNHGIAPFRDCEFEGLAFAPVRLRNMYRAGRAVVGHGRIHGRAESANRSAETKPKRNYVTVVMRRPIWVWREVDVVANLNQRLAFFPYISEGFNCEASAVVYEVFCGKPAFGRRIDGQCVCNERVAVADGVADPSGEVGPGCRRTIMSVAFDIPDSVEVEHKAVCDVGIAPDEAHFACEGHSC